MGYLAYVLAFLLPKLLVLMATRQCFFFPFTNLCDMHSAGCLFPVLSYILHKKQVFCSAHRLYLIYLFCNCRMKVVKLSWMFSLESPRVHKAGVPTSSWCVKTWRLQASCSCVPHFTSSYRARNRARSCYIAMPRSRPHSNHVFCFFFSSLHPSGDDTNGGTYVWKICAMKDFECPMRARKHGAVWEARVHKRSGMSFRSFCIFILKGHSLTSLWCWWKNKY